MADYEVAIVGAGLASYFAALTLARAGTRVLILEPPGPADSALDVGLLWPGLTDHWGILKDILGQTQVEALLGLIGRSRELIAQNPAWSSAQGRRGAVMQLASNATEMFELTTHLRWLNDLWPRRLMSAGSASNYLTVNQIEGAAFVGDCVAVQPALFQAALRSQLQQLGVTFQPGTAPNQTPKAEITLHAGSLSDLQAHCLAGRWLFSQAGLWLRTEPLDDPWNPALVAVESHRGHLMILPPEDQDGDRCWRLGGIAPGGESTTGLLQTITRLAGDRITSLRQLQPQEVTPVDYICSADGLPLVGPLLGARRWLLTGFASRSWSLAPALGEQVARALLGQSAPELGALPCLRPTRFS